MRIKDNKGISLLTVIVTVIVMIILAGVATTYSLEIISDSGEAQKEAAIYEDREIIRNLMTNTINNKNERVGFALLDDSIVVIGSGDKEYGTGYHLIPGGDDKGDLGVIKLKLGDDTITAYRNLSAPYVVDYYTGKYERIENIKFKD